MPKKKLFVGAWRNMSGELRLEKEAATVFPRGKERRQSKEGGNSSILEKKGCRVPKKKDVAPSSEGRRLSCLSKEKGKKDGLPGEVDP